MKEVNATPFREKTIYRINTWLDQPFIVFLFSVILSIGVDGCVSLLLHHHYATMVRKKIHTHIYIVKGKKTLKSVGYSLMNLVCISVAC